MERLFDRENKFWEANKADLLSKYEGKVLLIAGEEVLEVHDDDLGAYTAAKNYEHVAVKRCYDDNVVYIQQIGGLRN